MPKFSVEDKLEAVQRVLVDGMTIKDSAKILGCHKENVRKWIAYYEEYGTKGLKVNSTHVTYDGEFKLKVVEYLHSKQATYGTTAIKFNIPSKQSIMLWDKIYKEKGPEALKMENRGLASKGRPKGSSSKIQKESEIDELRKELHRLQMENDYLKKLRALVLKRIDQENGKKQ